jgi:hypothetical protein
MDGQFMVRAFIKTIPHLKRPAWDICHIMRNTGVRSKPLTGQQGEVIIVRRGPINGKQREVVEIDKAVAGKVGRWTGGKAAATQNCNDDKRDENRHPLGLHLMTSRKRFLLPKSHQRRKAKHSLLQAVANSITAKSGLLYHSPAHFASKKTPDFPYFICRVSIATILAAYSFPQNTSPSHSALIESPIFGMVQISQIPGNTICGFMACGSLKSEGFGDGYTAFGVLPSPSCA